MSDLPDHLSELAQRKRRLQRRSAQLRHQCAAELNRTLTPAFAVADKALAGVRCVRRHPRLVLAAVAGVGAGSLAWRPHGALRWLQRGMAAWQVWLRVRPLAHMAWQAIGPSGLAQVAVQPGAEDSRAAHQAEPGKAATD